MNFRGLSKFQREVITLFSLAPNHILSAYQILHISTEARRRYDNALIAANVRGWDHLFASPITKTLLQLQKRGIIEYCGGYQDKAGSNLYRLKEQNETQE